MASTKYKEELKSEISFGNLYKVEEFRNLVKNGCFNDDDGSALAVKIGDYESENYLVSENYIDIYNIPSDVTHIWWFNK